MLALFVFSINNLYIFITKIISRCSVFICPHKMQNSEFNRLVFSVLQNSPEGQKSVRGTIRGLHFYKETDKICKTQLFLEFLAYLQ